MVNSSDLIVVGKRSKILSMGRFYGYQENADQLAKLDKLTRVPLGLPYVDFELKVNSIVMKNKNDNLNNKGTVVFRSFISHNIAKKNSKELKNQLFFLSKAPKGKTYGIKNTMYKLTLNGKNPVS